ncbi:MAG: heparan-alpha-glucosaminide N-acetyltransferase domain-containing protein [Rhodothermales bacterium]|nr:heparan-alpha-glucosaminide N-acetyltransferase domain-containing protein [Rhodothermales bacterium]
MNSATSDLSLPSGRLISLDVFRGITIVAMIMVNNPGSWSHVYAPLLHAKWHGWTPTDLIFPFFLFIVGVAVVLAFEKRLAKGVKPKELVPKIIRRAIILFLLGLFLAGYPFLTFSPDFGIAESLSNIRIPGVLQRIAICYAVVSLLYLFASTRTQVVVSAVILLGYWLAMKVIPVPGVGAGMIDDPTTTLAAFVDRTILGEHLWAAVDYQWDPEGILSTFPAIVTTLLGIWAGRILVSPRETVERAVTLFAYGVLLIIAGYMWNWFFPINKGIWTSSYVIFTGGQGFAFLGLCYYFIDLRGYKGWTEPFVVYGVNAITVFVMSGVLARTLSIIMVGDLSLNTFLYENVFAAMLPPKAASLAYAIVWIVGWYFVLVVMYRRKIIIKV